MALTDAQVQAALLASPRRWSFRYEVRSGPNLVSSSPQVAKCTIANNYLATGPNRTCQVTFGPDTTFDQLTHNFRAYARLLVGAEWMEWLLGTFRLSGSSRRVHAAASDRTRQLQGYDYLVDFQEAKLLDRYADPTMLGQAVTTRVGDLIGQVGSYSPSIVASTTTFPGVLEWPPGTPYLTVINQLLGAINYESLSMDVYGQPVVRPYVAPEAAPVRFFYKTDAASVIRPGIDSDLDLWNVPNVWVGYVSEPDRTPLRSVAINDDADSATSTANRGRQIVKLVDTGTLHLTDTTDTQGNSLPAATQADLDALVARARSEDSTIYEQVRFDTGLMPFHGNGDVISVDYGEGAQVYRETGWSMDLVAGGTMTHECRRAVTL